MDISLQYQQIVEQTSNEKRETGLYKALVLNETEKFIAIRNDN